MLSMVPKIKCIFLSLFIIFPCLLFSACYDRREIDELAYPIAIGLDKGDGEVLRLTLQIVIPTKIGEGGEGGESECGGSGGAGSESVSIVTVEPPSIYSGLNMINTYVSKQLNLSHVKAVIFSEELAREGIEKYIKAILRGREFRPTVYVLVARGTQNASEKFIREVKPELESNPAKYYEMIFGAHKYTGFTMETRLITFNQAMTSYNIQPVAVLAGVSKFKGSDELMVENSTCMQKGRNHPLAGDYLAGEMPKVGNLKTEVMGVAVFNGGKMVGEMDGEETLFQHMVMGKYGHSYLTIPDPREKGKFVLLNLRQNRKPKTKVEVKGEKPLIDLKIRLEADLLSIQSGINYENVNNMRILETATEEFLKEGIERMLKRTAKEFESDINGFGEIVKSKFLTWDEWVEFNWLEKYKKSSFNVGVDVEIRRSGHIIKTIPEQSNGGGLE